MNSEPEENNRDVAAKFKEKKFSSPSLDILENEKINSSRKIEKENIKVF